MPKITAIHLGIIALTAVIAVVTGWIIRAKRCAMEKLAINAGWQEHIVAQRLEHGRLVEQNRDLMERVSQFKGSAKDAANRAKELSTSLVDLAAQRDDLNRELGDVSNRLEAAHVKRKQLEWDLRKMSENDSSLNHALEKRDKKIFNLSRELENWQQRVPPLVEKYRVCEQEAEQLQLDLAEARARIHALESVLGSDQTRVEPVDPDTLADGLDASNDPAEASARINDIAVDRLRDDLKCIKGIGPAIEKTLNELGIFRLSQIAELTEYDIDRVASRLKGFRTRIYREDWIGQAREMQDQPSDNRS